MTPSKRRIMIVEDQRLIAADLEHTLKRIGYEVAESVASGEEAVPKVSEIHPDLILMDVRLRGQLDGIQAAEAISARADIPVVYLTAYADEQTILRAKGTTPFGYIVKPFNERELRAAIEVALYKHEAERLLAEERARRRAAEEFKLLVETIKDYAIFMLDATGHVASWNEGARRIKGYTAREILGKHFSVFYPPEERALDRPAAALARALRDGRAHLEGWRVRKDGSCFWANVVLTAILDSKGLLHGFGKVTHDMTERKRQEEMMVFLDRATLELAASLDLSTTLPKALRVIVPELADWCLIDVMENENSLVQAAAAHFVPGKEELALRLERTHSPGLNCGALHVFLTGKAEVYPELKDMVWAAKLLGMADPELLRQLGVCSCMCVPIQFRGRNLGVLSLLRANPHKGYKSCDLPFAQEFARRVAMAMDNARLFDEAKTAISVRDEFLQIASHELKTPLTPLQLQLEALARTLDGAGVRNERLTEKLLSATRQTMRLSRLVETLLDVTRITTDRVALKKEPVDLPDLVRDVTARFSGEARKAGSEIVIQADEPITGLWDRLRVEQIVSNLLTNAIRYGQGEPIVVEARVSDGIARISVTDRGIGIDRHSLERVFERFERAVPLCHFGGLGLGLFIARHFAEAHGGTIAAQSRPGAGSTFTVFLPLQAAVQPPSGATNGAKLAP